MAISRITSASIEDDAIAQADIGTIQSVGETAPSSPFIGQRWYRASTAITYQYTNDGTSSFWLDVSSGGIGTSVSRGVDYVGDTDPKPNHNGGSATLSVGQVYYNREKNKHFVCTTATDDANVWAGRYAGAGGNIITTILLSGTYYRVHAFLEKGTFYVEDSVNVDILIVAGGGSGGKGYGGGGGAGGLLYKTGHALTANNTYDVVIGAGGAGQTTATSGSQNFGNVGGNTTWTITGGATTFTANGGGRGGAENNNPAGDGGSGGGAGYYVEGNGDATQNDQNGATGYGFNGGEGTGASNYNTGGGGGAGSVGGTGVASKSGNGGTGRDYSTIFGTGVGDSGWFASGGGGGWVANVAGGIGTASSGGGSAGGNQNNGASAAAKPNTGGGSGGGASTAGNSGAGGSGIVVLRYALS